MEARTAKAAGAASEQCLARVDKALAKHAAETARKLQHLQHECEQKTAQQSKAAGAAVEVTALAMSRGAGGPLQGGSPGVGS